MMGECLQKTALDCSVAHRLFLENKRYHVEHRAVQDAVPPMDGQGAALGRNKEGGTKRARGEQCLSIKPVTREQQHALDGDVVVGTGLPRFSVGQAQHVTQRLHDAKTSQAHERLREALASRGVVVDKWRGTKIPVVCEWWW
jgi:hypothetical protein